MKSFKQMVSEVAKPISPDEQRFIDQHTYEVQQHPVALDHQFTGDIAGKTSGKGAEPDASKYDASYAKKDPAVETIGEETKEVELSEDPSQEKPMMMGALRAMSHNMMGIAKYVQSTNDPEEWFQNKLAGVAKEMQTLYSYATAETMQGMATEETVVENKQASIMKKLAKASASSEKGKKAVTLKKAPWEKKEETELTDEELSAKQKKIDHNKNGKIDGHDLAMLRKKKNEEVALGETTTSALKRPVTQTGPDGKTRTIMKKAKVDRTDDRGQDIMGTNESVALEEAMKFKPGAMRLKDGSQVVLKKEDAQALTSMFKDLSRQNQKKLGEVAQKDKSGFEEILGFAREAL